MSVIEKLVLATSNAGKIAELKAILSPIECISQQTLGINDAEETGLSFIENAIIKARHASHIASQPALADDSGLVIPFLDGKPGIYSARFAGTHATDDDNIAQVLTQLKNVPESSRHAYFYCAIALVRHANDPTPVIATGYLHGSITDKKEGHMGFGYDPIFFLASYNKTLASLPADEKNKISHRACALRELSMKLQTLTTASQ